MESIGECKVLGILRVVQRKELGRDYKRDQHGAPGTPEFLRSNSKPVKQRIMRRSSL